MLSEVSDIESYHADSDQEKSYSSDYVNKLKTKLKVSRNKIRDRNKVIHNQNEDIDNFLEDIRNKEMFIFHLKHQIQGLENDSKHRSSENNLFGMETPDFLDTVSSSMEKDEIICELIALNEECCSEVKTLKDNIDEMKINGQIPAADYQMVCTKLQSKLQTSQEKIERLSQKLSKYVELGLISHSELYGEEPALMYLDAPSKTVNEIRHENEQLIAQNVDLRVEVEELRQKLHNSHPQLNSSLAIDQDFDSKEQQETNTRNECSSGDNETFADIITLSHTDTLLSKGNDGRETNIQPQPTLDEVISENGL